MKLITKDVGFNRKVFLESRACLKLRYPKNELLPSWYLTLLRLFKLSRQLVFYLDDLFIGTCLYIPYKDSMYIVYFSIPNELVNEGYGAIVNYELSRLYLDKTIFLDFRTISTSDKRFKDNINLSNYYRKLGFMDTGYYLNENNRHFKILANQKDFSITNYEKAFTCLSFGLYKPKITTYQAAHKK